MLKLARFNRKAVDPNRPSLRSCDLVCVIRPLKVRNNLGLTFVRLCSGDLQEAVRERGWYYPPDPASLKECSLGGNIATNAGGPRCLKYGVTRHYVLGLEVVLADGEVLRTGGRCHKNKTGFDLVGPFVGSEGMLGVVTEATLRLIPHPPAQGIFDWPQRGAPWGEMIWLRAVVQQALISFFSLDTFERFPQLKLGILEVGCGWIGAMRPGPHPSYSTQRVSITSSTTTSLKSPCR